MVPPETLLRAISGGTIMYVGGLGLIVLIILIILLLRLV